MRAGETQHTVCMPVFPGATILDIAGPYQIFASFPGVVTQYVVAASTAPVKTAEGITLVPDHDFAGCPPFDVLMVPGGPGQMGAMEDAAYVEFLRTRGAQARYVTSVCVGALLLARAGLLDGYRATTHWASLPCLALFPHVTVASGYPRYVVDRNRITGGGVSSGIDEALEIVRILLGEDEAQRAQLFNQYAPHPPVRAGDPCSAPARVLAEVDDVLHDLIQKRRAQILRILRHEDTSPGS